MRILLFVLSALLEAAGAALVLIAVLLPVGLVAALWFSGPGEAKSLLVSAGWLLIAVALLKAFWPEITGKEEKK